jgi:hypothetical protein
VERERRACARDEEEGKGIHGAWRPEGADYSASDRKFKSRYII